MEISKKKAIIILSAAAATGYDTVPLTACLAALLARAPAPRPNKARRSESALHVRRDPVLVELPDPLP